MDDLPKFLGSPNDGSALRLRTTIQLNVIITGSIQAKRMAEQSAVRNASHHPQTTLTEFSTEYILNLYWCTVLKRRPICFGLEKADSSE